MEKIKKRNQLKKNIGQAITFLKDHFKIDQVILFGSQAAGKSDAFSDIDLAVISPDFARTKYKKILNVFCDLAVKHGPIVELRPYTPADIKTARPTNFLGYIFKTGTIVYKNGRFLI
ncbi:nucleotidyltransferase domain-containing protein [Candidatus Saganbacteria bacterium]|nr:nucleotidyltransferase domain-containing protein [Candidatus Saganbacteria bacterium]